LASPDVEEGVDLDSCVDNFLVPQGLKTWARAHDYDSENIEPLSNRKKKEILGALMLLCPTVKVRLVSR
jgi:hypothetical protein